MRATVYTSDFTSVMNDSAKKGERNDCAVKAVTIATGRPYDEVHASMANKGRRKRSGTPMPITYLTLRELGFRTRNVTKEFKAKTVTTFEREVGKKQRTYLVRTARHILCVKNGEVHDWTKGRRHRIKEILRITPIEEQPQPNRKPHITVVVPKPSPQRRSSDRSKVGIVATIIELVQATSSRKPTTRKAILGELVKRFPERDPQALKRTVGTQIGCRIERERGIVLVKTTDGKVYAKKS